MCEVIAVIRNGPAPFPGVSDSSSPGIGPGVVFQAGGRATYT